MSDSLPISTDRDRKPWLWVVLALMAIGLAGYLRFDVLGEPSLWYDEILHFEKTEEALHEPWYAWFTGLSVDRENGSLYYATQRLALQFFEGEFAIRLMPALAGLSTVGVLLLVGLSATGSWPVAVTSALLLAISPLHVYYSREGRPYAAVMLAAALLLLLALERRRSWTTPAAYLVCIAMAYLGAVAAPILVSFAVLAGLEWFHDRRSKHSLFAAMSGLTVGLLLFPTVEQIGSATAATKMDITQPLSALGLNRLLASLTVSGVDWGIATGRSFLLLALAIWGLVFLARRRPRKAVWVTGLFVLPIVGWLTLLVVLDRWYNVRYTSAGLPAFLVLVAIGLVDSTARIWQIVTPRSLRTKLNWGPTLLLAALLLALLAPLWRAARTEPLGKPDWRGVAELIGTLATPEEPVITRGWWSEKCIRHYLNESPRPLLVLSADTDLVEAKQLIARHPHSWVLAAGYLKAPQFRAWMHTLDPISKSRLANLELYFHPDFSSFLTAPTRSEALASILATHRESEFRQEFEHSELLLGAGWSYPERSQDGITFRWSSSGTAQMGLLGNAQRRAQALRMRLLPFPSPDRPPQTVEMALNSQPLAGITLGSGWKEYEIPVPAGLWNSGANVLTFEFGWHQSPSELDPDSPDSRDLAVAFDYVEAVSDHETMSSDVAK